MVTGRPTKYEESFIQEVDVYIEKDIAKGDLPTVYGLALHLNVNRDTLFEWAKVYPDFSDSLKKLNDIQANNLINKGLKNEYNSTIAKLMLSANHGMKERVDTTTNDKDLPTPIYGSKSTDV